MRKREPELRLVDVAECLYEAHGIEPHKSTLARLPRRCGIIFKKTVFASDKDRGDVALARWLWVSNQKRPYRERLVWRLNRLSRFFPSRLIGG